MLNIIYLYFVCSKAKLGVLELSLCNTIFVLRLWVTAWTIFNLIDSVSRYSILCAHPWINLSRDFFLLQLVLHLAQLVNSGTRCGGWGRKLVFYKQSLSRSFLLLILINHVLIIRTLRLKRLRLHQFIFLPKLRSIWLGISLFMIHFKRLSYLNCIILKPMSLQD